MTQEELRARCSRIMAATVARLEDLGGFTPAFYIEAPGKGLIKVPYPQQIEKALSDGGMGSGDFKRQLFDLNRAIVAELGATATVFVSDAWMGKLTKDGEAHLAEVNATVDRGFEELVRRGWVTRTAVILVTGQTVDWVCLMQREYAPAPGGAARVRWIGEAEVSMAPQDSFQGRQKMFGDLSSQNLGEFDGDKPDVG